MKNKYFLHNIGIRPDARLVFELVYGSKYDLALLSTESERSSPADRNWTWLFFRPKKVEEQGETVSIEEVTSVPLVMEVESTMQGVASLVSYFMKVETGCRVTEDAEGANLFESGELLEGCIGLNPLERIKSLETSVWRSATLENPYPSQH